MMKAGRGVVSVRSEILDTEGFRVPKRDCNNGLPYLSRVTGTEWKQVEMRCA